MFPDCLILSCILATDTNFSIKCGGSEVTTPDGMVYESDNSISGTAPTSFYVSRTEKWGVSNVGLYVDRIATTASQVTGTNTPELFKSARISPGSLRYYGLGLVNGPYIVSLQFAEMLLKDPNSQTWESTGRRIFDIYIQVKIMHQKSSHLHSTITLHLIIFTLKRSISSVIIDPQGILQLKDFDIAKEAGGVQRAIERKFNANVYENYIEIHLFWAGKGTCCIPYDGYYGPSISALSVVSGNPLK